MKICFMCDLHLPYRTDAIQYDVLKWACCEIQKNIPDVFVFAGGITADGSRQSAEYFMRSIKETGVASVIIPGESDLRAPGNEAYFYSLASGAKTRVNDIDIIAVNDADANIPVEMFEILESASKNAIIVMHLPCDDLSDKSRERFRLFRKNHPENLIFHAQLCKSFTHANTYSLQAADPDKAIGESPCITYFDTETKQIKKSYYFCVPSCDIYDYIGISCFYPELDIRYAAEHNLKCIELCDNAVNYDRGLLLSEVNFWRSRGGINLSMHAPEITYINSKPADDKKWNEFISLAQYLGADRITLHVPKISVKSLRENPVVMNKITSYLAEKFRPLKPDCVIGVENIHMTEADKPDDTRRFGYTPGEVKEFMLSLRRSCDKKVGINFDTANAADNAPFSQKYTLGAWYAEIGHDAVGYHIHRVINQNGKSENHMPITDLYGSPISYASFFKCASRGMINKAPIILEIRGRGEQYAYKTTAELFRRLGARKVFDLHSHTYYSNCGRDDPNDLIKTAIESGISLLGITDHSYGIAQRKAEYLEVIRALSNKYRGKIKILCGIEIPSLPEVFDIDDPSEIKDYDYCLIEHITCPDSIIGKNIFEFCKRMNIRCGIAHTNLFAYCTQFGYNPEEFFKKMAELGIFWEMNMSYDSIHNYREHQYVNDFMQNKKQQQIVKDSGVYISVGFDSHRYEDYAADRVHKMYDFLTENGFNTADKLFG